MFPNVTVRLRYPVYDFENSYVHHDTDKFIFIWLGTYTFLTSKSGSVGCFMIFNLSLTFSKPQFPYPSNKDNKKTSTHFKGLFVQSPITY